MTFLRTYRSPKARTRTCKCCQGWGKVERPIAGGDFAVEAVVTCPECKGTGRDQHRDE